MLSNARRAQIISALIEGNSVRATCRMCDVAKGTVLKLLVDVGWVCFGYQEATLRNLPCTRIEADEIWSFVYAKKANVPKSKQGEFGFGDVWTWTALDPDSKLLVTWHVGTRDTGSGMTFMRDLRSRLANRVQLTTDGHNSYLWAVTAAFEEGSADYAQLHKTYGPPTVHEQDRRYSPPQFIGTTIKPIFGDPNLDKVSTSCAERHNLTMRMSMRRFTRLTNGHSKKLQNHLAAISLHAMAYNFTRSQPKLGMTPAMAIGVADHVWSVGEIVALMGSSQPRSRSK